MAIPELMLRGIKFSFLLLACSLLLTPAHGMDFERFAGQWRGNVVEPGEGLDVAGELVLKFSPVKDGFELEWTVPGGGVERSHFVEVKEHPGVYSVQASKGGFLGFLSSPEEVNPLNGDPLTWARFDADTFVVYKLVIDDAGAFTLDRYQRTIEGDGLRLELTRRAHGEPPRSLVARLERSGGPQ